MRCTEILCFLFTNIDIEVNFVVEIYLEENTFCNDPEIGQDREVEYFRRPLNQFEIDQDREHMK
jgi:hypothetical protein